MKATSIGTEAQVGAATGLVDIRRPYERPALRPTRGTGRRLVVVVTAVVDLVAITGSLVGATALRFGDGALHAATPYGRWLAVWVPLWWIGLIASGTYEARRTQNPAEELRRVVQGVTVGAVLAIVASYSLRFPLARGWILIAWLGGLAAVMAGRRVARKTVHVLRRRGRLQRRALIVGADPSARELATAVEEAPWEGLDVVGFVSVGKDSPPPGEVEVVGEVRDLRELAVAFRAAEVLVAPTVAGNGHMADVVAALDGVPVDLRVAPGLEGFFPTRMTVGPLGDHALLTIERIELRPLGRVVKRILDLLLGGLLLALAAPVIAFCAIAVRLDSPGPAFFRQRRIGKHGRPFVIWKLRTMRRDAEELRPLLESRNEGEGLLFKIEKDPRITRVGRLLRRWSLDELPQLINVLAGHMSLVGPRPPLPTEVDRYDDHLGRRLLVKPGITGLWQVSGRGDLSFEDYVRYDLMYVQNWSPALDLYILAKTLPAVLSRRGAY